MKNFIFKKLALVSMFFLAPSYVEAKDYSQTSSQTSKSGSMFNFDIYSLSKKKENAFDASSATYIITSEDIRRSGVTSIPEALRMAPGVQVSRIDGNKWAITIRGFDRQFSNKLLVMIDGRTVYTPLFSGVFWELTDYLIEDIDKIEVVRGPGGTIWGANAVNGIINIITKNAAQTQGSYVSQVVGNEDKSITEVRYGGKTADNDHYRIYAKKLIRDSNARKYSDGKSNDDGTVQDKAGFRYDITSIKDSSISVHGDISSGKSDNYFTFDQDVQSKGSRTANLMVSWDKTLSKKSSFTLQSYLDYDQFDLPVLKRSGRTFDVDFQHFYNFSKENQFIWGLGYRDISDDIEQNNVNGTSFTPIAYYPDKRNDEIYSAFIQDKIGLIADKLYWTIGSKFLMNDYTGFEYQPNTRLTFYPSRNQTLWAAVSRAVRTPTRGEISFDIKDYPSGYSVSIGSPQAESENVLAYEAGYRIKPTNKTLFDLTGYYNKYSKLRTYEDIGLGGTAIAANLGSGESYGFEAVGKWQVNNELRLEASYDYLKMNLGVSSASSDATTSVLAASDRLALAAGQSPKNQFRVRSYYNITPKIEFDNMLYYVDELPLAKTSSTDPSGIPAYFRFDTRIGYIATKNLDFSFGIKNLFDDRHSEFKAASYNVRTEIARTYYMKAVWQY